MNTNSNILIAPLNWGIGHATRCIPIIHALKAQNFKPIIVSSGKSLKLLEKEFPNEIFEELPDYKVLYSKKGIYLKLKIFFQVPKILYAIYKEKRLIEKLIQKYQVVGIISDNRLGCFSSKVPSVYITHQINVYSGNTTYLSSTIHHMFIKKFTECWVPDNAGGINLTGKLSHDNISLQNVKYIGPITRFHKEKFTKKHDLLVLLSGPEPQRTLLEEKLIFELKKFNGTIIFVKGLIDTEQKMVKKDNFTFYNFMESDELSTTIQESKVVIARSGYSTIMDLAFLKSNAFLIPTPGQFEQEYLAVKLKREGSVPSCSQDRFSLDKIQKIDIYSGFRTYKYEKDWLELFSLFQSKRKL